MPIAPSLRADAVAAFRHRRRGPPPSGDVRRNTAQRSRAWTSAAMSPSATRAHPSRRIRARMAATAQAVRSWQCRGWRFPTPTDRSDGQGRREELQGRSGDGTQRRRPRCQGRSGRRPCGLVGGRRARSVLQVRTATPTSVVQIIVPIAIKWSKQPASRAAQRNAGSRHVI